MEEECTAEVIALSELQALNAALSDDLRLMRADKQALQGQLHSFMEENSRMLGMDDLDM